jgi:hypothetical protein
MNLKRPLYNSFDSIIESVKEKFDTVVYDYGIKNDRYEIFDKMRFFGLNPPPNACLFTYITLPTTYDNMLITNSSISLKKSSTSINEVKIFLENIFGDNVDVISPFRYTMSGKEISSDCHKIQIKYSTLINFSY